MKRFVLALMAIVMCLGFAVPQAEARVGRRALRVATWSARRVFAPATTLRLVACRASVCEGTVAYRRVGLFRRRAATVTSGYNMTHRAPVLSMVPGVRRVVRWGIGGCSAGSCRSGGSCR